MRIYDVPPEILSLVASHLDVPSATSLSQFPYFEEAADSRLYRDIIITHADQFAPLHNLIPTPPGSPVSPSFQNRPLVSHIQSRDEPTAPNHREILRSVGTKTVLQSHLHSLLDKPWRVGQVRKIEVQLGQSIPKELDQLLALTEGGVGELKLGYPGCANLTALKASRSIAEVLVGRLFPRLKKADIEVGSQWARYVGLILKNAPGLRYLKISGDVISSDSPKTTTNHTLAQAQTQAQADKSGLALRPVIDEPQVPPNLQLEVLEVTPMSGPIVPLLSTIISNSPHLQSITLSDPTSKWSPTDDDPLIIALHQLGDIRHLSIPSSALSALSHSQPQSQSQSIHPTGLGTVEHLDIAWNLNDLNASAYVPTFLGDRLTSNDSVSNPIRSSRGRGGGGGGIFPDLPTLTSCDFLIQSFNPGSTYDVFRGRMFDLSISSIRQHALLTSLNSTPLLKSINMGQMYGMSNIGPLNPPVEKWDNFDGVLITHYYHDHNGDGKNQHMENGRQGDRDHFCHIRHRSAFSCGWAHYAVFNGLELRPAAYASLTDIEGVGISKVEPGIRELSKESWEVLRHWTAQL